MYYDEIIYTLNNVQSSILNLHRTELISEPIHSEMAINLEKLQNGILLVQE